MRIMMVIVVMLALTSCSWINPGSNPVEVDRDPQTGRATVTNVSDKAFEAKVDAYALRVCYVLIGNLGKTGTMRDDGSVEGRVNDSAAQAVEAAMAGVVGVVVAMNPQMIQQCRSQTAKHIVQAVKDGLLGLAKLTVVGYTVHEVAGAVKAVAREDGTSFTAGENLNFTGDFGQAEQGSTGVQKLDVPGEGASGSQEGGSAEETETNTTTETETDTRTLDNSTNNSNNQ